MISVKQEWYNRTVPNSFLSFRFQVDVTNLLSDEGGNYLTPDENENPKKISGDEKYQSLSSTDSSVSTDQAIGRQFSSNFEIDHDNLTNAAHEIENDLNNLAAIIQEASQIPTEDDDTSKQATQNYDLHDQEQEVGSDDFFSHQIVVLLFTRKNIYSLSFFQWNFRR